MTESKSKMSFFQLWSEKPYLISGTLIIIAFIIGIAIKYVFDTLIEKRYSINMRGVEAKPTESDKDTTVIRHQEYKPIVSNSQGITKSKKNKASTDIHDNVGQINTNLGPGPQNIYNGPINVTKIQRVLDNVQKKELIKIINEEMAKNNLPKDYCISVKSEQGDNESFMLAKSIASFLDDAGYNVCGRGGIFSKSPRSSGVSIFFSIDRINVNVWNQ
jgi:hypothetical protein